MIISIIGFMAAGKTTLGESLGKSLGAPVVDLDHFIEEREGKEISKIFEEQGEAKFREIELDCLEQVLEDHISENSETIEDNTRCTLVLSLGGGIVMTPACRELISRFTYCVYLKRDPEVILQHLLSDRNSSRPVLEKAAEGFEGDEIARVRAAIDTIYRERAPLYEELADKIV